MYFFLKRNGTAIHDICVETDDTFYYSQVAGGLESQCFMRFVGINHPWGKRGGA